MKMGMKNGEVVGREQSRLMREAEMRRKILDSRRGEGKWRLFQWSNLSNEVQKMTMNRKSKIISYLWSNLC